MSGNCLQTSLVEKRAADYFDSDGLLVCGTCGERKEYKGRFREREMVFPVMCSCRSRAYDEQKEKQEKKDRMLMTARLRTEGIREKLLRQSCFEADDGMLVQSAIAKYYVDTWKERKKENNGLLFWGDIGTGKTFLAACIANRLIDNGVPVLMTSFPRILNCLSGDFSKDREEFIRQMMQYDLLIIDDLGAERKTDYAAEQICHVVDERYKTNLPMIITTNLTLNELEEPSSEMYSRISDRVLAVCTPVEFRGESRRRSERSRKRDILLEGLKGGRDAGRS